MCICPSLLAGLSALLLLSPLTLGTPVASPQWADWLGDCFSDADTATLVRELKSFCIDIDLALAMEILTSNSQQLSYSGMRPGPGQIPPGDIVSADLAQFITQEETGGSNVPFTMLNIWHGCDFITFRWLLNVTDPSTGIYYEYYGIDVLELELHQSSYKIKTDYGEFSV